MKHPKIPLAQTVIQLCKAKEIKHIVISPGSRNAPLTIGFTHDNYFTCYSIVDERCAGFFALGIAQQTQNPAAIVCTSGSALLNYYPAIAEAYYSDIPLVVLSADRPKYLIGIGDGQTINQRDVFENHILYSVNLKQDIKENQDFSGEDDLPIFKNIENQLEKLVGLQKNIQEQNEADLNEALNRSITKKGPVHVNIPFNEPLYEMVEELSVHPKIDKKEEISALINPDKIHELVQIWNASKRKIILVGVNSPKSVEQNWLNILAKDESVIVFTETTSNLHHKEFFSSIDKIIAPLSDSEFKDLQPDLLLTFGGMIVSKKIKAFLREYKPKEHWHINEKHANDTFFSLSQHLKQSPNEFLLQFLPKIEFIKSPYKNFWQNLKDLRQKRHDSYINEIPFSDLKVFNYVLNSIPDESILQLSNSSTVRYAQLFDLNNTLTVYCNRGTSGIDGSTSTAIGCANSNKKQTVLITGDLSFFYDSNALWNNYIPNNFRIIIINNEGGGIFRILPGNKDTDNFDTFFETKHHLTAKHLSEMYGFMYSSASNEGELEVMLQSLYQDEGKPKILEIFTPRKINDEILLDYFKAIK